MYCTGWVYEPSCTPDNKINRGKCAVRTAHSQENEVGFCRQTGTARRTLRVDSPPLLLRAAVAGPEHELRPELRASPSINAHRWVCGVLDFVGPCGKDPFLVWIPETPPKTLIDSLYKVKHPILAGSQMLSPDRTTNACCTYPLHSHNSIPAPFLSSPE